MIPYAYNIEAFPETLIKSIMKEGLSTYTVM
jgi:hypothetical protein